MEADSLNWFFELDDDGVVHLMARLEGDDGMLADAREDIETGGEFYGVSYEALKRARNGEIEIDESGKGRIVR